MAFSTTRSRLVCELFHEFPQVRPRVFDTGFWFSLRSSYECFGLHLGGPQSSNLGDGNGWVNQTYELRQDYGSAAIGTCLESLIGGNHLRLYRQNGSLADSGALFLAVSQEENVLEGHDIVPDGYDVGRNKLVAAATAGGGETEFGGVVYETAALNVTGLLQPGAEGINHSECRFFSLPSCRRPMNASARHFARWNCYAAHGHDKVGFCLNH